MLLTVSTLLFTLLGALYFYLNHKLTYWERRKVPFVEPSLPFGNVAGLGKKHHICHLVQKFYNELKGKALFGGVYFLIKPVVVATDLNFIKNVIIKDFHHFEERGIYTNEKDDILSGHLIALESEKWKTIRPKLSPAFTSGKMKSMFPTIMDVAGELHSCLSRAVPADGIMEMKDILARFTTDVIGSCAFGIDCNSLTNPNAQFRVMGRQVFTRNSSFKFFLLASFKSIGRSVGAKVFPDDLVKFFSETVFQTVDYREQNNIHRKDLMDLLIELKNKGTVDGEKVGSISIRDVVAQSFGFFIAGFETSSSAMAYCIYELAQNVVVQEKVRQEIEATQLKYGGQFTYEAMMDMDYLNSVILETIRLHPTITSLDRIVTKDYPVPEMDLVLEKGTRIFIPLYAIHRDAEYFPNPLKFDPDRFLPSEMQKRHPMSYLAFGEGPRSCIAQRFGMMQTRIGLVALLQHFEFTTCEKTIFPLTFETNRVLLMTKGGLYLRVRPIT